MRWGGARKGQGSFYTRPGLVAPTVQRTLAPLCYELPAEPSLDELRDPAKPRPPSVILALKVCDPATGSASFPVSALRYITEALWRSLLHHQWLAADEAAGTFRPVPAYLLASRRGSASVSATCRVTSPLPKAPSVPGSSA